MEVRDNAHTAADLRVVQMPVKEYRCRAELSDLCDDERRQSQVLGRPERDPIGAVLTKCLVG
jgi:hypothetical protein